MAPSWPGRSSRLFFQSHGPCVLGGWGATRLLLRDAPRSPSGDEFFELMTPRQETRAWGGLHPIRSLPVPRSIEAEAAWVVQVVKSRRRPHRLGLRSRAKSPRDILSFVVPPLQLKPKPDIDGSRPTADPRANHHKTHYPSIDRDPGSCPPRSKAHRSPSSRRSVPSRPVRRGLAAAAAAASVATRSWRLPVPPGLRHRCGPLPAS